MTKSNKQLHII